MRTGYSQCEKMSPWVSKSEGKGTKSEPRDTKSEPKGSQREPKGAKSEPAGAKSDPTGPKREPKVTQFAPGPCAAHRRGVLGLGHSLRVSFPHAPFPRSRSGFCSILFFSRRIPSWIPPFPSLVGRFLATFWQHFAQFWLKVGCRVFVMFFWDCFWTIFDVFLTSFGD